MLCLVWGCNRDTHESASAQLHALFDEEWEFRLEHSPLFATSVGDTRHNHLLPDFSLAAAGRSHAYYQSLARRLEAIPAEELTEEDRVSRDVFELEIRRNLDTYVSGAFLMPFNADSGFHIYFARLGEEVPLRTEQDYRNYIARLQAWPGVVDGLIETLREGLRRGMTPPAVTMQGYEATIAGHMSPNVEQSPLYRPFLAIPFSIPSDQHEALRAEGRLALTEKVAAGYEKLYRFFVDEYLPGCRTTLAASDLPGGKEFYEREVQYFTTLPVTAEEVHEIGLREVARIREEMAVVMYAEFVQFLRSDPRFYAKSPEELLRHAAWICKRIDGVLPAFFGRLPRQPYTVEPVPDAIAPKYTAGRYVRATEGGAKGGIYWLNTYALHTRPIYALEALTLHEAVPGHHLQIALAAETENLPPFRRHAYFSAFGEGWGLYAERLGLEAGFYKDPYSNFGRLSYEIWRAARLVVDTAVHSKGWTRQQVIDYLAENTALSLHECTTETDRYISWPGQALAYKIGELKIRELRQKAERELGAQFDLRAFHDAVLHNGAVPLATLERVIDGYIEASRN
jgi:uncharacterized protein (DUF885 family)